MFVVLPQIKILATTREQNLDPWPAKTLGQCQWKREFPRLPATIYGESSSMRKLRTRKKPGSGVRERPLGVEEKTQQVYLGAKSLTTMLVDAFVRLATLMRRGGPS